MSAQPWLEPGDELLLDGVDYRVVKRFVVRADRSTFQHLTLQPQLGGEGRELLQLREAVMEAQAISPDLLDGRKVQIDQKLFDLKWEGTARTERNAPGAKPKFANGRCAWYEAPDKAVAVLIVDRYESSAIMGEPLASGRIDLRFTEGLRASRRG